MQDLITRPRRLRMSPVVRDLVAESHVDRRMLVQPHFVVPGSGVREPISAMPGISHESVDKLVETVAGDLE
ncbi:MAG: porphobilinogen synthase, partial [Holophagae bacterium]